MNGSFDIDVVTSAAFALQGRPGAYALLLGSGVSTGAGVPTGWRIVELLIEELAAVEGDHAGDAPGRWYRNRFGEQPTYSSLVARLGLTNAERQALIARLLNGEDGRPRPPAPAHRAIARLVLGRWVRVVITTNFDRLVETALTEAGVNPTVLATPEAIAGAVPLVHAGAVVVKLHGDQNDPRIRNTDVELDEYEPAINTLLDTVFNDYGLIVCGWSADSDPALRRAIERAPSRRFTTFWTSLSDITEESGALATLRQAELVEHVDADTFFGRLADACEALAATRAADHRSVAATVAVAKRELAGATVAIPLHDWIRSEIARVQNLGLLLPHPSDPGHTQLALLDEILGESERLIALVATAAYWGGPEIDKWWTGDIVRMAHRPLMSGSTAVLDRPRLPALLICWAAGIAAVAAGRDDLVATLFCLERVPEPTRNELLPPVLAASPELLHATDDLGRLYRIYRPVFVNHLSLGRDSFCEAWERWQYLLFLAGWDLRQRENTWVQLSTAGIRVDGYRPVVPIPYRWALAQVERLRRDHPLLRAGFFGGKPEDLMAAIETSAQELASAADEADRRLLPARGGTLPSGRHYPGTYTDDPDVAFSPPQ
jgi:hypothetical protein